MKKPSLVNSIEEIDTPLAAEPAPLTLAGALVELERQARQVVGLIAVDPVRRQSTHDYYADLSAIEIRGAELLAVLARRRM